MSNHRRRRRRSANNGGSKAPLIMVASGAILSTLLMLDRNNSTVSDEPLIDNRPPAEPVVTINEVKQPKPILVVEETPIPVAQTQSEIQPATLSAQAEYELSKQYIRGTEQVPQDIQKGLDLLKSSSSRGHIEASLMLGHLHFKGVKNNETRKLELAVNVHEAIEWYKIAGDKGNDEANYYLGFIYQEGGISEPSKQAPTAYNYSPYVDPNKIVSRSPSLAYEYYSKIGAGEYEEGAKLRLQELPSSHYWAFASRTTGRGYAVAVATTPKEASQEAIDECNAKPNYNTPNYSFTEKPCVRIMSSGINTKACVTATYAFIPSTNITAHFGKSAFSDNPRRESAQAANRNCLSAYGNSGSSKIACGLGYGGATKHVTYCTSDVIKAFDLE